MPPSIRASSNSPKRRDADAGAGAEDDVLALARRVEAAVMLQTKPQPSGLDAETERKAAAHMCRAFPACFGLRGATPQSLNEVAFLIVRHLTQKAEQRRLQTQRTNPIQARVKFRMQSSSLRNTWPHYGRQGGSLRTLGRQWSPPAALPSAMVTMVSVEPENQE